MKERQLRRRMNEERIRRVSGDGSWYAKAFADIVVVYCIMVLDCIGSMVISIRSSSHSWLMMFSVVDVIQGRETRGSIDHNGTRVEVTCQA